MLYLPSTLPALKNIPATPYELHHWAELKGVRRVLLLNLMPEKEQTENDICSVLAATGLDLQLIPIKIPHQTYKTTPLEHMQACYVDITEVMPHGAERLIVTGAPLEQISFKQVRYWQELCQIMDWAHDKAERTLYICWAAQAALYHRLGIVKRQLPAKCFGVFPQRVLIPSNPLMQGLNPNFPMPNSRHTELSTDDILRAAPRGLQLLAASEESGVGIMCTADCREVYTVGHLEYNAQTLDREYHRDLKKNLPIQPPRHYYDEAGAINYAWRAAAITFYSNFCG